MKRQKIAELLKEFRAQYNLTQLSAAKWCLLAPGTYRDYEQGRSEPGRGIDYMIRHRIADYAHDYEQYMAKQFGRDEELQTIAS
jgi:transcriptional regulator with XRE-family HTH domain